MAVAQKKLHYSPREKEKQEIFHRYLKLYNYMCTDNTFLDIEKAQLAVRLGK